MDPTGAPEVGAAVAAEITMPPTVKVATFTSAPRAKSSSRKDIMFQPQNV